MNETKQEISEVSDDMTTSDYKSSPVPLAEMEETTTNAHFTCSPVCSSIRTFEGDSTPNSVVIEQEDEQVARFNVMGVDSPNTKSNLLQSSDKDIEHSTETENFESSATTSIITKHGMNSIDEYDTRSIFELLDNNRADAAMNARPYANFDVMTEQMTQRTTNQKSPTANRRLFFQKGGKVAE